MFGNMRPIEKGSGRDEVDGHQLQAQHSHPREDIPVNTYDYALNDASVPRTTYYTEELIPYVQALSLSTPEYFCSFDNYCTAAPQTRTKGLSHETTYSTTCLESQDGEIQAPATELKDSSKSEITQPAKPKIPASEDSLRGNAKSTNINGPGSFPAILPLAREEISSDNEENYKQHFKQINIRASQDKSAQTASSTISRDDVPLRTLADKSCVYNKTVSENSGGDSPDYETSTSRDLKRLLYKDRARKNSYLGGIGSWTHERSPSPNKLLVKDTSGKKSQPPLLELAGPTTSTQQGSHHGSGSNQDPTRSFQGIRFGGSGNQQSNGKQHGRKRSSTDNDDGENNGPAQPGTPEATREAWRSQGKVFACPFNKHDPEYYRTSLENEEKYIKCAAGLGWNIPGLKEHIYRVHEAPLRCRVCGLNFASGHEDACTTHQLTCREKQQSLPPLKGMTADMKIKIRDRHKHGQNPTEFEKWLDIYRILFPNETFPSPYRDEFYYAPSVSSGYDIATWPIPMDFGVQTASTPLDNVNHHRHMSSGDSTDSGYFSSLHSTPKCGNIDCPCCRLWVEGAASVAQNSYASHIPAEIPFQIQQESNADPSNLQMQPNTFNAWDNMEQFPMDQRQDDENIGMLL